MRFTKKAAETRVISVGFSSDLLGTEVLSGTPTVVEVGTSALTIANEGLNNAERTIMGAISPVNTVAQFTVAGGIAGTTYVLRVTMGTSGTPAQTLVKKIRLKVN